MERNWWLLGFSLVYLVIVLADSRRFVHSSSLWYLEKAELIHIEKGYEGKRPRTWVTLTAAGQTALREEIAHLKQLIQQVEQES